VPLRRAVGLLEVLEVKLLPLVFVGAVVVVVAHINSSRSTTSTKVAIVGTLIVGVLLVEVVVVVVVVVTGMSSVLFFPQTKLALTGSYLSSIELPLCSRICRRQPRYLSLGTYPCVPGFAVVSLGT
jgi:hypothetical protein